MFEENIDKITFFITVIGFYFAYYQWFKNRRDKKKHLLKLLKVQLDCLGPWVSSDNEGYGNELTKNQKFNEANPSKLIYQTGSSLLIDSNLLEQMSDVPEEIVGEINQLYYDFKRIESIQKFRNDLVTSDVILSSSILDKLNSYDKKVTTFESFLHELSKNEMWIVSMLVSYGEVLHCKVIGNKHRGARLHWERTREWVLNELRTYKKPQLDFILITIIILTLLIFALNLYLKFDLVSCFLIIFLLTLATSISSKAIIVNNEIF